MFEDLLGDLLDSLTSDPEVGGDNGALADTDGMGDGGDFGAHPVSSLHPAAHAPMTDGGVHFGRSEPIMALASASSEDLHSLGHRVLAYVESPPEGTKLDHSLVDDLKSALMDGDASATREALSQFPPSIRAQLRFSGRLRG